MTPVGLFVLVVIPVLYIIVSELILAMLKKEEKRRNQLKDKNI